MKVDARLNTNCTLNRNRFAAVSLAIAALYCGGAYAATKSLECKLTIPDRNAIQTMLISLDDDLDHAEVIIMNDDTDCSRQDACAPEVFKKTVLPSVIRLTQSHVNSSFSSSDTIDIDRSTLAISSHTLIMGAVNRDTTLTGSCVIKKVDTTKKLL